MRNAYSSNSSKAAYAAAYAMNGTRFYEPVDDDSHVRRSFNLWIQAARSGIANSSGVRKRR